MDVERKRAMFFVDGEFGDGVKIAMAVADMEKFGVLVVSPCGTVVDEPKRSIGRKDRVGRTFDFDGERKVCDADKIFILIKSCPLDEGSVPVPEEETVIKVLGEASRFFELGIVVENWAGAGGSASFFEFREFL